MSAYRKPMARRIRHHFCSENVMLYIAVSGIAAITASDTVAGMLARIVPYAIAHWIGFDLCGLIAADFCETYK